MQIDKKLLDDMAKVAGNAVGVMTEFTKEAEVVMKKNLERVMQRMDFVPRQEFEVMREVALKARSNQQALEKRIATLEKKLGVKAAAPAKKAKPAKAKKTKKAKSKK